MRYILILLFTCILGGMLMPVALAQSDDSLTLTITPPLIKVNMMPGETWNSSIKIVNNNHKTIRVYASPLDFKSGSDGGVVFLEDVRGQGGSEETADVKYRLSQWIEMGTEPMEIAAQESIQIPFTIKLPQTAEPGGHYAAILIGTKPDSEIAGSAIKISSLLASLVMLNIKGEIVERGNIREFSTPKKYFRTADVDFNVKFENTGNVHLQPQGKITIYDMYNKLRDSISINLGSDFGNVLPESFRKWNFKWTSDRGLLDTGRYKAMLILTYGEEAKETVNQTLYFWVVDYYYLGAIAIGLFLLILFIVLLMRLYIRRAIKATQKEAGYVMPTEKIKKGGTSVIPKSVNGVDLRANVTNRKSIADDSPRSSGWSMLKRYFILSIVIVALIAGAVYSLKGKSINKTDNSESEQAIDNTNTAPGFTVLPPEEETIVNEEETNATVSATSTKNDLATTILEDVSATSTKDSVDGEVTSDIDTSKIDFEKISIKILNGSGIAGVASKATSLLENSGFKVSSTGNADNFNYSDTVIRYSKSHEREAEFITTLIEGMEEMEASDADSDEITVIIGKNFKQ